MRQRQKFETVDIRSKRTVAVGKEEDEGKGLSLRFTFNDRGNLSSALSALYSTKSLNRGNKYTWFCASQ
jgi:hypothetical protein